MADYMKLKIATYNISGGFYEDDQSVDFLDKEKASNIDLRLLNDMVKIINDENNDFWRRGERKKCVCGGFGT